MIALEDIPVPRFFRDIDHLDEYISTPNRGLLNDIARLDGDIMVLGVGGKVGPTLSMMAKRAAPEKRIIGVARFSQPGVQRRLHEAGIETISCDLLDRNSVDKLPDLPNVVYMAGKKFGTAGSEPLTWAMNTVVPTFVCERFHATRFVAFSTLCIYPFSPVDGPGANPHDTPLTPIGEYANSCVGRERVFQYYSQKTNSPGVIARLNYAIDCRYGVLHDIAWRVRSRTPIDIRTNVANCIWQGDAISQILRCLCQGQVPATAINIGSPIPIDVRQTAMRFGEIFGIDPVFSGENEPTAWHNDCSNSQSLFGDPVIELESMIHWNADWIQRKMPLYNKPTHYEERQGTF